MLSSLSRRRGNITGTDATEDYTTIYAEVMSRMISYSIFMASDKLPGVFMTI